MQGAGGLQTKQFNQSKKITLDTINQPKQKNLSYLYSFRSHLSWVYVRIFYSRYKFNSAVASLIKRKITRMKTKQFL